MHEYTLAGEIARIVLESARQHDLKRVLEIQLEIGMASGISVGALTQAWEILRVQNPLTAAAELTISRSAAHGSCIHCGYTGPPFDNEMLICPLCGEGGFKLLRGKEFLVSGISGEERNTDC
jgi:hydrogenase nickel incorporation protein HypA/HybF